MATLRATRAAGLGALLIVLAVITPAQARTLKGASGFRVAAPADFRLSHDAATGVYRITSSRRRARVSYLRLSGAPEPRGVVDAFVEQAKGAGGEAVAVRNGFGRRVVIAGRSKVVEARTDAGATVLTTYGRTGRGTRAAAAASLETTLRAIARRARGGAPIAVPQEVVKVPVAAAPLRPFTTADGLARAQVPADASFNCTGTKGALECYSPKGEATLGVPATICPPGSTFGLYYSCPVTAPLSDPATVMTQIWPRVRNLASQFGTVGGVTIERSQPVDMAGFSAEMFLVRFTRDGQPWNGAFLIAVTPNTGAEYWLMYFSGVAVPDGDDSSFGQALIETWSSWNPSAAIDQRLTSISDSLKATTETIRSVDAFRQAVHEVANANWNAYIRM